ncbi:unnamed protein product [Thlaspi arvense]|uniref:MLO-like protein n=1 Tax=Thlaspi arvense TaxID=13288 RepID=A0AAU9RI22_THLAR|nr:unnamed protein product [Thlaspi arvense]
MATRCFWYWTILLFCSLLLPGYARASSPGGAKEKELSQTPTWAVALVCTFFILVSVLLEKGLHRVATWLWEKHKNSLLEALEKIKAELMILGFISLLLTFGEQYILEICIPEKAAASMLPCPDPSSTHDQDKTHRRHLAAATTSSRCDEDHEPLISVTGLHQLHILLFFMAVFHILYSFITMMLGRLKIRGWKKWEQETFSHDYEFSVDPSRFRLTHETSFVRQHSSFWTKIPFFFYAGCFLQQFFRSVGRTDYLTLRHGFIASTSMGIIRAFLTAECWETMFWASILPIVIILAVGTKLQAILTRMALGITDKHAVVQGIPLVHGSDKYFWFNRPQLLLHLLHFALFQNAFQITYFFWIWYSFKLKSCFHKEFKLVIVKLSLGVGALILCSYITLPLYALVTQMGSHMKKSVFDEQMAKALKKWHMAVKKKKGKARTPPTETLGGSGSVSTSTSAFHASGATLLRSKTTGHSTASYMSNYEDQNMSDLEAEPLSPALIEGHAIVRAGDQPREMEHAGEVEIIALETNSPC